MEDIRDDMQEIESAHRGFIISADTNFLAPYYNAVTSLRTDTVAIRALSEAYPFRKELYDRFISYVTMKVVVSNISVELVKQNKRDSAIMRVSSGYGRKTMDSIRSILHSIELQDELSLRIANKEQQLAAQSTARWLVSLVSILLLGAFILAIQVFRDLRLREVNEKKILYLAGLTEKTSDGIISIDPKGAILSWNQGATNMFGFTGSEAVGKDISIITRKETEWSYLNETVSKKNIGANIEWTCFNKSNQSIFCLVSLTPLYDDLNHTGYVLVLRDITDRKLNEDLLEKFNDELNRQVVEKTKEKIETEARYNDELRKLTVYLQTVREEERTHISREIHDELGQQLTVLKMGISWVGKKINSSDEKVKEKLSDLVTMIDTTVQSVRKISSELRPSMLDDLGLQPAMEWQAQEFEKRSGISVSNTLEIGDLKLPGNIPITFFRIFQESLTNIARHAEASTVSVRLRLTNGVLEMIIRDNGKGFSPKNIAEKRTLGLLGMKERATTIGGKVEMKTEEGKGTTVTLRAPVGQV